MIFRYLILSLTIIAAAQISWAETTHTVKKGETIFGIAHKYGITPEALIAANPQVENTGVKKNMVLVIPDGTSNTSTATAVASADNSTNTDETKSKKKSKSNKQIGDTGTSTDTQPAWAASVEAAAQSDPAATTVPEASTPISTAPISTATDTNPDTTSPTSSVVSILAQQGDTFESIAQRYNVSEELLIELNPFVDPIRIPTGTQIRLSDSAPYNIYADLRNKRLENSTPANDPVENDAVEEDGAEDAIEEETPAEEHRNIMLMLPFMAGSSAQSKTAKQYAEFYRGFLIAANQYNNYGGLDVEVLAFDTNNDNSAIRTQLSTSSDRDIAVIIAPEDESQLHEIINQATDQGIYVLNMFDFKSEAYKDNPYVLQGNINQQLMYEKAIHALSTDFRDHIPVILSPTDAKEEKAPFIAAVRSHYISSGIQPVEIVFDDALKEEDLNVLDPDTKYVFLYKSGSQSVFNRAALTLLNVMAHEDYNGRFGVFGYPDWTMFRNDALTHLHQLGAVIYSRFDLGDYKSSLSDLQEKFSHWYGAPMLESFPSQGALGYDVGGFLLTTLQTGSLTDKLQSSRPYQGVQSTFNFSHDDNSRGYINNALYIITYRPDGSYSSKVL